MKMQVLTGLCPDSACGKQLYFASYLSSAIECTSCGQYHEQKHLLNVKPVSNPGKAIQSLLQSMLVKSMPEHLKKTGDSVKVKGLSNYGCKLISPLLTKYGLDKSSQEVKLLKDMGQGETFDCCHLADRAFRIEEKKLLVPGYGRDAAAEYLQDTLREIAKVNNNEECLVPIHADGDGHCLLHAVSRALVGHELFWHPLMTNLKLHLTERQDDYKALLCDFFEDSEWDNIISEADPNFVPSYGEIHGLRNIHILGLANVLHRPVILIDSLEGMQSKGDYSAVFLPALIPVEECRDSEGNLHRPIVISWSSKGRNHFVPLVGIKEKALPKFPSTLLPKLWGLPQDLLFQYIEFADATCVIGGKKTLSEQYLSKIVTAMEKHFQNLHGVAPSVVHDVYYHIMSPASVGSITTKMVTENAHIIVKEERLYKCLLCKIVVEELLPCPLSWLSPGGKLYEIAKQAHETLKDGYQYKFPVHNNIVCAYNQSKDKLMLVQNSDLLKCKHCQGSLRVVKPDGSLVHFDGDQLSTPASEASMCGCGYKHFWDGKEYDNLPQKIPVALEWNNVTRTDFVYWFQNEADKSLNSNAFELAQKVVQIHFPGEFGSERLVQKVVDQIFRFVLQNTPEQQKEDVTVYYDTNDPDSSYETPTKIILTGAKSKTLHKEELSASKTEQAVRKKIEHGAAVKQKRLSTSPVKQAAQNLKTTSKKPAEDISSSPLKQKLTSNGSRKIRISVPDAGKETYVLSSSTTYDDIQKFIVERFSIAKELQIIKYAYPPKLFEPPSDDEPLNLKNGEGLVVTRKKMPLPKNEPVVSMDVDMVMRSDNISTSEGVLNVEGSFLEGEELPDTMEAFSSCISSLLQIVNLWEWACTKRRMFQPNGIFFEQAFREVGQLTDNQHLSLPCFPGKIFSYNQKENELFLCLGETHINIQPLSAEQLDLAHAQGNPPSIPTMMHPPEEQIQFRRQEDMFSRPFVPTHISSSSTASIIAFSGAGHSLVDKKDDNVDKNKDNELLEPVINAIKKDTISENVVMSSSNGNVTVNIVEDKSDEMIVIEGETNSTCEIAVKLNVTSENTVLSSANDNVVNSIADDKGDNMTVIDGKPDVSSEITVNLDITDSSMDREDELD